MITAEVNTPYPSRIQLWLGTLIGPLTSTALGGFDPTRDLEVYVDGTRLRMQSGTFDSQMNRYVLFATTTFNLSGVVQVIHHMPSSPFVGSTGTLPGFALIATLSTLGDP